jgi:hypothetical protein
MKYSSITRRAQYVTRLNFILYSVQMLFLGTSASLDCPPIPRMYGLCNIIKPLQNGGEEIERARRNGKNNLPDLYCVQTSSLQLLPSETQRYENH